MTNYNAAAWLVDRQLAAGLGDRTGVPRRRRVDGLRRAAARGLPCPARPARPRRAPRRARRAGARRRAGLPGLVPRRAPLRRRAGAAVDDAHRARPRGDRRRRRRRRGRAVAGLRRLRRRARAGGCRAAPRRRRRCADRRRQGARARLVVLHRCRRGAGGGHHGGLAGVLAVQLGHDRRPEGRDAPPRRTAGDRRDLRPRGPRHRRRRQVPVRGQAVLRLRTGQLAHLPARRGRVQHPQPTTTDAPRGRRARPRRSSRRCSSPAPASSPACSTPTHPDSCVRIGAGDGDRRRGAARRSAAPLRRALRASRARRHRHDRGAAHLPLQPPRAASVRARAASRWRGTRHGSSTRVARS